MPTLNLNPSEKEQIILNHYGDGKTVNEILQLTGQEDYAINRARIKKTIKRAINSGNVVKNQDIE